MSSRPDCRSGKSFFMKKRFRKPDRKLQVFALRRDRFAGEFDDQGPIGDFALALPVAHGPFVILTAGFLDFVVNRRIAEVLSARIVAGNRIEDVVPERHCELRRG